MIRHARSTGRRVLSMLAAASLAGISLLGAAPQAVQATGTGWTITVDTPDDVVDPTDGQCSLREAVAAANTDTPSGAVGGECHAGKGTDTIVLDGDATTPVAYTLTGGTLEVTTSMWIIGQGVGKTIVQSAENPNTATWSAFSVSGPEVVIAHLTTRYGGTVPGSSGDGGGILHTAGVLTLYQLEVTQNRASAAGGGIYSSSTDTLNIVDSTISHNTLDGAGMTSPYVYGGGVAHIRGNLLIVNSTISNNSAGFTGMSGSALGGGIEADGDTFKMFYSTVKDNSAISLDDFVFGGGLMVYINAIGDGLISHSTISGNHAMTAASDNVGRGGGITVSGRLTMRNTTISGNEVFSPYMAAGGGLANLDDSTQFWLEHVTITGNQVSTSGSLSNLSGAGAYTRGSSISIKGAAANTVIAENTSSPSGAAQCDNILFPTGGSANAASDTSCGASITAGPFNFVALADNGGRTQTHEVTTGSVLIGAGTPARCTASGIDGLDQRLAPRAASCTIGAYEYDTTAPTLDALDDAFLATEDTDFTAPAPGVLENDLPASGVDADQAASVGFTYTAPVGPSHATGFTLNPDGSYSYTPEENFYGKDPFLYWIIDSANQYPYDMALVKLSVVGVNDPPYIDPDSPITFENALEDSVVNILGLVIRDDDLEDCPGAVIKVRLKVEHGTLWLDETTGLTFTIGDALQSTPDSEIQFWGTLADVNAALATLHYQGFQDYNGGETLTVGMNDMGYCDGDETGAGGCEGGGPGGTEPGGPGSDDNEVVDDSSVGFTIGPVNDPPENTVPGTQNTTMNTPLSISGVSVADIDLDQNEGNGQLQVTLTVTNGTASVSASGVTVTDNGTALVVISGSYANVLTAISSIEFTPATDFVGTATIAVTSNDLGNNPDPADPEGTAQTDTDSFDIIVGEAPVCAFPNCSFEEPVGPDQYPVSWKKGGIKVPGDGTDTTYFVDGDQSFRFFNPKVKTKKLYQDIVISGLAGDQFNLTFSWRGDGVTGKKGVFRVFTVLYYKSGSSKFYVNMPTGTNPWEEYSLPFTAKKDYKKLRIQIEFSKQGTAWFDDFGLTIN